MTEQKLQRETIIDGGTFNPPTLAHEAILQACIDHATNIDADVWIMPSGDRQDKQIGVDRARRLAYLDAMIADVALKDVTVSVNTTELDRTAQTETYDTVMGLNDEYPDRRFTWVFGSDSVETMPEWHNGEILLDQLPMLIVERPGTPITTLGRLASRLEVDPLEISSTDVRRLLEDSSPVDHLVSPSVLRELVSVE